MEKKETRRKLFHIVDENGTPHRNSKLMKLSQLDAETLEVLLKGICVKWNNSIICISEHSV